MGINLNYINGLNEQIENCSTCQELKQVSEKINEALQSQLKGITDQMAAIEPLLSLLSPPGLDEVPGWISGLISGLIEPMTKPFFECQLQLAELTASISEIASNIQSASAKFPDCGVDLPVSQSEIVD